MIVIANWKQNKTYADLKDWVETFDAEVNKDTVGKVTIVIAPSYPFIFPLKMITQAYPYIKIASQDISRFDKGSHTGEVGAFQLTNIVDYAIIGHSERKGMGETLEDIIKKRDNAQSAGITPIVCFSDETEYTQEMREGDFEAGMFLAYEPANAISTAANSVGAVSVDQVKAMVEKVKVKRVIYGGSVDSDTIENYLNSEFICGFLVGGASLDPKIFAKIVNKSAKY